MIVPNQFTYNLIRIDRIHAFRGEIGGYNPFGIVAKTTLS